MGGGGVAGAFPGVGRERGISPDRAPGEESALVGWKGSSRWREKARYAKEPDFSSRSLAAVSPPISAKNQHDRADPFRGLAAFDLLLFQPLHDREGAVIRANSNG